MILLYLFLILFFSFLLVKATDILIINFKLLSLRTGLRRFALTGLVLGLATSLPELFVGLSAAFEGKTILSLGNVIGSNIANLSLVIGGAALISGTLKIEGFFLKKDVFYAFLAGAAPMLLLFDKSLSRIDGLILIILYFLYQVIIFREGSQRKIEGGENIVTRLIRRLRQNETRKELVWIILGIILLLVAADFLVKISIKVALFFNLPLFLVGIFIITLGTVLPELVLSIKALRDKQQGMVVGRLVGSIVANGTLVLGLAVLISPFQIESFKEYLLATMAFVVIFAVFYFFIHTKRRLERWEGGLLLLIYLIFIFLEFRGF